MPQTAPGKDYSSLFDEAYYRTGCGPVAYDRSQPQWPVIFGRIADEILRSLRPAKVLDAGCALGFLVQSLWDRGVEAWGVDISRYAIDHVRPDMKPYCRVGSLAEPLPDRYDLVVCIEVLEHMPADEADRAIQNLTAATDRILFSSTPFDTEEATHFNVRPTLRWLEAFQAHGFAPDLQYDASFVAPHAMLLQRQESLPAAVLQLFSELIRTRQVATQNDNRGNQLAQELAVEKQRLDHLRLTQSRLAQEAKELHDRVFNRGKSLSDEVLESRLRGLEKQLALQQQASHDSDELYRVTQEAAELRSQVARLERKAMDQDRAVQAVSGRLEGLLQSRIWKALTAGGGVLLRLSGRKL